MAHKTVLIRVSERAKEKLQETLDVLNAKSDGRTKYMADAVDHIIDTLHCSECGDAVPTRSCPICKGFE